MTWLLSGPLALLLVIVALWAWRRVERRLDERERRLRRAASTELVRVRQPRTQPPGDPLDHQFAAGVGQVATVLLAASERYLETRDG